MAERNHIPQALRDKLLVDAMHRCCLCPEHHDIVDAHHIVPVREDGPSTEENLMVVCPTCHAKIHRLRRQYSPAQLRIYRDRWVALCRLGVPLGARLSKAYSSDTPPPAVAGWMPLAPQPYIAHPYPLQEHFTGRIDERKMLSDWFCAEGGRAVLALTSIGGMGKSALAWVWLQRDVLRQHIPAVDDPPDIAATCAVPEQASPEGVIWWSFYDQDASFGRFLDSALLYVSDCRVDPWAIVSPSDKLQNLVFLLQQRRMLLVLDGFERELRAYASVRAAYQGDKAPIDERGDYRRCTSPLASRFLEWVTSLPIRARVLIASRIPPRELDDCAACRRTELGGLVPDDAVALLRAWAIRGARAELEAACKAYDRHPLALRLLAGVVVHDRRFPYDVRAAKQHRLVDALRGRERHHILEVAVNSLNSRLRDLLTRASAFRGPVDYEAVVLVSPYRSTKALDAGLGELVDRGLLLHDRERGLYDLHPIVREYSYDRLRTRDRRRVHKRARDYFAAVPTPVRARSASDLAPLIELYHHTVAAGGFDEGLALLKGRLWDDLYYTLGLHQVCLELLKTLFPQGKSAPCIALPAGRAWVLAATAAAHWRSGSPRQALRLQEACNRLCRGLRRMPSVAVGLTNLALAQLDLGELKAAEGSLRESISISEGTRTSTACAAGRRDLCLPLAYRGEFAEALRELDGYCQYWNCCAERLPLSWRVLVHLMAGSPDGAAREIDQLRPMAGEGADASASDEYDEIRAEWLVGAAAVSLGWARPAHREARLAEAEHHLAEALSRCRRTGVLHIEPSILLSWARWHLLNEQRHEAAQHANEALGIADRCGYRLGQADTHNFLARLDLHGGKRDEAIKHAQTAYERAWCDGPPYCYKPALDEAKALLDELGVEPPTMDRR